MRWRRNINHLNWEKEVRLMGWEYFYSASPSVLQEGQRISAC